MASTTTRRFLLKSSGLALAAWGFVPAFARRALATGGGSRGKVIVTIFQRGAVDGLSMVPPIGETRYFELRPSIALEAPGKGESAALPLDGTFGLHPALGPLKPFWDAGSLAFVHAVGSPNPTRSHFDAQDFLEAGTPGVKSTSDGFLNRALQAAPREGATPFRAVAFAPSLPRALAGRAPAIAIGPLADYTLRAGTASAALASGFESLYEGAAAEPLRTTGAETFSSMRALREADPGRFSPRNGATYPASPLGKRLKEIAQLIRADIGLEVAATDCGGWDTHAGQGGAKGQLAARLRDLGESLSAFAIDLGDEMADVCVVTMTEFGRTVRENGTRGTDHGHGSVMTILGGRVKGKRVLARWRGLADADLFEGRDLPASTDHRDVLAEILTAHLGVRDLGPVFPGFSAAKLGLFA